jgi:tRNA dimethylallyltransferase
VDAEREIPLVLIAGPTASGKSALAMAIAQQIPAEIVSVDSAQVYRGMDIGTAKPSREERSRVPHHLIDLCDPADPYSAARFARDAARAIAEIRARGKVPLLVGGTMLYVRALLHGLSDLPPANAALRARLQAEADAHGWPALHARLAKLDAETAARLSPNDGQRIQRALEIIELSGEPATRLYRKSAGAPSVAGPVLRYAMEYPDRAELHARIEQRLHEMMRLGFAEEVRLLHARDDLSADLPSMRSVGYRQLWKHFDGEWPLDEAVQRAIFASRQLAKRQLTWLRSEPAIARLDPRDAASAGRVLEAIRSLR